MSRINNNSIITDAVNILRNDGIIIIPTDTVYGIAASSQSEKAIQKIYEIKKRNNDKKIPYFVDYVTRLKDLCEVGTEKIKKMQGYFPGPVTLVLKRKSLEGTIAVRMINNEMINRIINLLGAPLCVTSANVSGKGCSNNVIDLIDTFDGAVEMIIVGDKVGKVSSTIVNLVNEKPILVREGSIPFEEILMSYNEEYKDDNR